MNASQLSVSAAFLVIGVLIAARHSTWVSNAVQWVYKPVQAVKSG